MGTDILLQKERWAFLLVALCPIACGDGPAPTSTPADTGSTRDTDADASPPDDGMIGDIEAEVSDAVKTVVTVRWTTEVPSTGRVEYGPTDELVWTTPAETEPSYEHEALLLGLTFGTIYYFSIEAVHDEGVSTSVMGTVKTGPYQTALPVIEQSGSGHDYYTIASVIGAASVVTVIDPDGNYVWYHFDDRELDLYRARLALDGKSIIYNSASVSGDPAESSEIVRVSLDGTEVTNLPVPLLAHDFVEMPDGTIGAIATEYRDFDGETLRGDRIVEISPDGDQTDVWTSWDCFDPETDRGGDMADAWAFANALDYDPEENAYYLGMRNFSSIAKIDRESGACEWVLGDIAATISFTSGSLPFLHQHQFQVLEESILVLDNDGPFGNVSRVVEYSLDLEAMEATEVWSYTSDPEVYTFVLGEPIRLSNGDTMVNWSAAGLMERASEDGESKWQIGIPMGYAFGFNTIEESLYR